MAAADDLDLLKLLAERASAHLPEDEAARQLLRDNGVADEGVWSRYRLGASGPALVESFNDAERQRLIALGLHTPKGGSPLRNAGILMPTFDPQAPDQPVGFVKLSPAQNKHGVVGQPRGLGCAAGIGEHEGVIVADAPLLVLRLAQAGAAGVVLAEDAAVLPPLAEWLKGKRLVAASYKKAGLRAMGEALKALGLEASAAQVHLDMRRTGEQALRLLGMGREDVSPQRPPTPITPQIVRDLWRYAHQRLAEGEGLEALAALGADDAALVETYGVGFLPLKFRAALPDEARRALMGHKIANTLVLPAYDERGAVVDLVCLYHDNRGRSWHGLRSEPCGLLAPNVATAHDHLTITDTFQYAALRFKEGERNALLLRGPEDATRNAKRLAESGVRSALVICRRNGETIAKILEGAGIATEQARMPKSLKAPVEKPEPKRKVKPKQEVTPPAAMPPPAREEKEEVPDDQPPPCNPAAPDPKALEDATLEPETAEPPLVMSADEAPAGSGAPPVTSAPPLELLNHDRRAELATFQAGEASYTVEVSLDADTRLEVSVRRGVDLHRDRFDLAVAAQRRRFAESAALKTKIPFETVDEHLLRLLDEVRALQDALLDPSAASPAALIAPEDRARALAYLKRLDLLEAIRADLDSLGWVGEDDAKLLLYLVAVSRKLPDPLWSALRASPGAGKSHGLDLIAELTPPEELIHVSRLTDSALYYQNGNALKNKLVVLDEADSLTSEVTVALRVLKTRGALSLSHVQRDFATGGTRTEFVEARGPVAVLTSTAGKLDAQLLSRCYELPVDESPEQTARVLEAQRKAKADPGFLGQDGMRERIVRLHRDALRLLECRPVLIPFAGRIAFPATSVRHRREQERFLALIEASALLHQHQRLKDGAFIVADVRDFEVAKRLAADSIRRSEEDLSRNAQEVLALIAEAGTKTVTLNGLHGLRPGWTRHKLRAGLDELLALEVLSSPRRTRPRQYRLAEPVSLRKDGEAVALKDPSEFGDLAAFGGGVSPNSTQEKATG